MDKPKKLLKKIYEHELVDHILRDAMNATKDLYESGSTLKVLPKPIRPLTQYESYLNSCGISMSHLITILEQIVMLPAYIEEYSSTKAMRRSKITRLNDIAYHYENFIIRAKSIDDRILQLCNSIFHLGYGQNDVNFSLVLNNSHIKSSDISDNIKDIHNCCDIFGSQRNKIIHQHSLLDEDLRKIELMLHASRNEGEYKIFARSHYRSLIKEFANKKVPEMNDFISNLMILIIELLNSLQNIYEEKKKMLAVLYGDPTKPA
ncbi:Cthe_2314 family HEPN domain-containing protein [Candidatus Latescibacterota bacterium]